MGIGIKQIKLHTSFVAAGGMEYISIVITQWGLHFEGIS